MRRLVGQHGRSGNVADGVNTGYVGAAEPVGNNRAPIQLDIELFQPQILDIADNAHCRDHSIDSKGCGFAASFLYGRGDLVGALVDSGDLGRR